MFVNVILQTPVTCAKDAAFPGRNVFEANRRVDTVTLSREQRKCFQTQENVEKSGTKLPGRGCGGFRKHRASSERVSAQSLHFSFSK